MIPRIKFDSIINTVDDNGFWMIHFWIKCLENYKNGMYSFIEVRTK